MTTSDVHVPPFEPLSASVTRAPAPVPSYYPHHPHQRHHLHQQHRHHPYYLPTTRVFQNSTTDPTFYSLSNHIVHLSPTTTLTTTAAPSGPPAINTAAATSVSSIHTQSHIGVCSNSRINTSYASSVPSGSTLASTRASTSTAINNAVVPPSEQQEEQHQAAVAVGDDTKLCEKYKQFLDSNHQERSVMIDKLVDVAAEIIDSIWYPLKDSKVVTTRNFIQEILKRSKATYLTLQLSLFYLFRVKSRVHERLQVRRMPSPPLSPPLSVSSPVEGSFDRPPLPKKNRTQDIILCGRRMFLASLMVASKYLQDKNYRNKAWAKIAGLDLAEINTAELAFLGLIDYKLFISKPTFDRWYTVIHGLVQKKQQEQTSAVVPAINTNV